MAADDLGKSPVAGPADRCGSLAAYDHPGCRVSGARREHAAADSRTGAPAEPTAEPVAAKGRRSRWLFGVLGPLMVIGVLGYVLATHGSDIGHAADRVSAGTLVLITALALVTLLARSEEAVDLHDRDASRGPGGPTSTPPAHSRSC